MRKPATREPQHGAGAMNGCMQPLKLFALAVVRRIILFGWPGGQGLPRRLRSLRVALRNPKVTAAQPQSPDFIITWCGTVQQLATVFTLTCSSSICGLGI